MRPAEDGFYPERVRSAGDQATQPSPTPQPATLTVTPHFGGLSEVREKTGGTGTVAEDGQPPGSFALHSLLPLCARGGIGWPPYACGAAETIP